MTPESKFKRFRFVQEDTPTQAGDLSVQLSTGRARVYRSSVRYVLDSGDFNTASGVPQLNGSGYVATSQLGSGATGGGGRFLADDYTWKAGGGGGTSDHTALSNLAWSTSGHTGTASRFAVFDGSGAAAFLALPSTGLVGWNGTTWIAATISSPLTYSAGTLAIQASSSSQSGYLSSSDWSTFNAKEPSISAGTTSQYWRGDKSWQTLDKTAVGLSLVENTALSTWAGSTNLVTLGTVATGTWNASTIAVGYGGTGLTSYTTGDLLYASGSSALSKLAIGANKYILGSNGTSPAWYGNGDLDISGGVFIVTQARGLRETSGPTTLTMGSVSAGELLIRSGTNIIGAALGVVVQAYNALLLAIAGLSSNGFIVRTSATTARVAEIKALNDSITVTSGTGTLDPTIGWNSARSPWNAAFIFGFRISFTSTATNAVGCSVTESGVTWAFSSTRIWPDAVITVNAIGSVATVRTGPMISTTQAGTYYLNIYSASSTANHRIWCGLFVPSIGANSMPGNAVACVVYDSATSANWVLRVYDGTSGMYTDTPLVGFVYAINTRYVIKIQTSSGDITASIYSGGTWSAEYTVFANIPPTTAQLACGAYMAKHTGAGALSVYCTGVTGTATMV